MNYELTVYMKRKRLHDHCRQHRLYEQENLRFKVAKSPNRLPPG